VVSDRQTDFQIEHRRGQVANLYLEGKSLRQIGEVFGVSHVTIKRDVDAMYEEWRNDRKDTFDEAVIRMLRAIDKLESESWDAWVRSCKDAEKVIEETGSSDKGPYSKSRTEVAPQAGDPRFLQVILQAMQRRCAIIGIDSPKKIEDVTPTRTIEVLVKNPGEVHSVEEFLKSYGGRN
jgi:hypothetical protein